MLTQNQKLLQKDHKAVTEESESSSNEEEKHERLEQNLDNKKARNDWDDENCNLNDELKMENADLDKDMRNHSEHIPSYRFLSNKQQQS